MAGKTGVTGINMPHLADMKFEFVREIGGGTFSSVWMIRDMSTARVYVLKLITTDMTEDQRKFFAREVNILAPYRGYRPNTRQPSGELSAHNIIGILDSMQDVEIIAPDGRTYTHVILMEYFAGEPLNAIRMDMTPKLFYDIARKLLVAVKFLHDHDIVHRDIKPQNIVYNKITGGLRLVDFGLACDDRYPVKNDDLTCLFNPSANTPGFMSPQLMDAIYPLMEQERIKYGTGVLHMVRYPSRKIGNTGWFLILMKESDIWAVGMTLYLLITQTARIKEGGYPLWMYDWKAVNYDPSQYLRIVREYIREQGDVYERSGKSNKKYKKYRTEAVKKLIKINDPEGLIDGIFRRKIETVDEALHVCS